jgi:hypothetical protein
MTKFILAALLGGHAAAFSTININSRAVMGCHHTALHYKDSPQEDSYGYNQRLPINGTVLYNDFEIRESEFVPSSSDLPSSRPPAAIEPTDKPSSQFISPIQMIKLVPKVTPVTDSSVFFVAPVIDRPSTASSSHPTVDPPVMKPKWSPRAKFGTAAFQSSNYLESLSPSSPTSSSDYEDKMLQSSLRNQRGLIRDEKLKQTQAAMQEATRRTNPAEAIMNRMAQAEELRKKKEVEQLDKIYQERMARLDEKRRLESERELTLERYVQERKRVDDYNGRVEEEEQDVQIKRGIPILTPYLKKSQGTPLLIGGTITLRYENLTPFQAKAIEVAQSLHREHCIKVAKEDSAAGNEGGIQAAPIVAIIDCYTGDVESNLVDGNKRFATLASVEVVRNKGGEAEAVNFMGVGRVLLRDYFSSKDAGLTREEDELNKLLERINYLTENDEDQVDDYNEDDDDDFSIPMAEFDLLLDDSSILSKKSKYEDATKQRASSMHAVTELYRTANKVYRLHEERKKLLSGLRAGQSRLNFRETENEVIEYDDWSDADIDGDVIIEDYGFGTYGIFSTIPDLTREMLSHLEPYYSPAYREREEYEAEVASFVALRVLEKHASPLELAAAMMAPSATERLYMAYGIMSRHRDELLVLVKKMNQDLLDCGEECSDLW